MLILDQITVIAACGRAIIVFKITSQGHQLVIEQETCLPNSLKINAIEAVEGSTTRFIITSDRTFAVYSLTESNSENI